MSSVDYYDIGHTWVPYSEIVHSCHLHNGDYVSCLSRHVLGTPFPDSRFLGAGDSRSVFIPGKSAMCFYPTPFHQNDPRDEAVTVRGETGTVRFVVT